MKAAFLGQGERVLGLAGTGSSPALMYPNLRENANIQRLFRQAVGQYLNAPGFAGELARQFDPRRSSLRGAPATKQSSLST
jgi:hypothetical protein